MNGRTGARRIFVMAWLMLALFRMDVAFAQAFRPNFNASGEDAPMMRDNGFRLVARGDAAVPPLTPMEAEVILRKATEAPWSGAYERNEAAGTYLCRQCGVALYRSKDKFDSGCGWPAFDDALPDMVRRLPDADGYRVEIECNNCGAHLGHVFEGERLTYTASRDVDYQNEDLAVGVYYNDGAGFTAGTYRIEVYADGRLAGQSDIVLR